MGGGYYDEDSRSARTAVYSSLGADQIFNKDLHEDMNSVNIKTREALDSEEHPESVPIIVALDVTGSMDFIPLSLVREGLPTMMNKILQAGAQHPQLNFIAIGDHECDKYPLQVGQFESSDELIDKWLTAVHLEEGGGWVDGGESYLLAWAFAAFKTTIDSFNKRGKKGFLFTIGDEANKHNISAKELQNVFGDNNSFEDETAVSLLAKTREKYEVYHLHTTGTYTGKRKDFQQKWSQLMGENLIIVDNHNDIPGIIAKIIAGQGSIVDAEPIQPIEPNSEQKETSNHFL